MEKTYLLNGTEMFGIIEGSAIDLAFAENLLDEYLESCSHVNANLEYFVGWVNGLSPTQW